MRKGFTLIELLIGVSIGIIVIGASIVLFSYGYRLISNTVSVSRGNTSVSYVVEIINSDLRKAGYGIENQTNPDCIPVKRDLEQKKLTIRYVDYEKDLNGHNIPDCENETFKDGNKNDCDYVIIYLFNATSNNLYRSVDKKADDTFSSPAPMFDESIVEIDNFSVKIDNNTHIVKYVIKGRIKKIVKDKNGLDKKYVNLTIGDAIICRNWR